MYSFAKKFPDHIFLKKGKEKCKKRKNSKNSSKGKEK
jgi:hypothetical protein